MGSSLLVSCRGFRSAEGSRRYQCSYTHLRPTRSRASRPRQLDCQALFSKLFPPKSPQTANAVSSLLGVIQGTQRGLTTSEEQKEQILSLAAQLQQAQASTSKLRGEVNATWKLLWTTEKETLFILKNAPLFRSAAGDVFQVIDGANKRLQNVITFPPKGSFVVDSFLEPEGDFRHNFKFSGARFTVNGRSFKLPPFGKGWFDTIYLDNQIRIAKDIRVDTLVVEREGPPRKFA